MLGRMPETPWDAVNEVIRESVIVEHKTFLIDRPRESDRLLDHPAVRSAFAADEYLPYWADLWPAARMLAKVIVKENWSRPNGDRCTPWRSAAAWVCRALRPCRWDCA